MLLEDIVNVVEFFCFFNKQFYIFFFQICNIIGPTNTKINQQQAEKLKSCEMNYE